MSLRQDKVSSVLQKLVADYFAKNKPDDLLGFLTIKKAEVTADLEHAKVFFSVIGQDQESALRAINRHLRRVQSLLFHKLEMKMVPRVAFVFDGSDEYADHINKLLKQVRDDKK